ncbi:unnamed protein product [Clonostachys rosea]|uniref:Xylanolytic transcriptional activator regulatory domain-containing protein n=1 Tax=Bionectria ochroleuca TaxID=29856 RepID=A0ABY6UK70_BIOOC|nr:unnamed protein product [Clonostachys rosea]
MPQVELRSQADVGRAPPEANMPLEPAKSCDGKRPTCQRCEDRHLACVYTTEADQRGSISRSYISLLRNRVSTLESVLKLHCIDVDASIALIETGKSRISPQEKDIDCLSDSVSSQGLNQSSKKSDIVAGSGNYPFGKALEERNKSFFSTTSGRSDLHLPITASNDASHVDGAYENNQLPNPGQERFNLYSQSLTEETLRMLPSELTENLIDLYFEWEQPWLQVVDETLFRDSRERNGRYFSPLLLCCILAIASRFSDDTRVRSDPEDPNTAGLIFLEHAEALLHFDLKWPNITTVQSLTIMAIFYVVCKNPSGVVPVKLNTLQATGADAAGWLHHGMATGLIIDMGLNIDSTSVTGSASLTKQEIQLRRQIYWALYSSDKLFASYTGRVCTMLDTQGSVPLPIVPDPHDALTSQKSISLVSLQRGLITQCQILEDILMKLYAPKKLMSVAEKKSFFDSCLLALQDWFFSLPNELKIKPSDGSDIFGPSPHAYILHMVHHTSIILLSKPFLPQKRSPNFNLEPRVEPDTDIEKRAYALCCRSASEISILGNRYREAFTSFRRSPLTATHCTLTAALVNLFLSDSSWNFGPKRSSIDLRSNMMTLQELSDSWTPPRRYWQRLSHVISTLKKDSSSEKSQDTIEASQMSQDQGTRSNDNSPEPGAFETVRQRREAAITSQIHKPNATHTMTDDLFHSNSENFESPSYSMNLDELDFSTLENLPWDYTCDAPYYSDFQWF